MSTNEDHSENANGSNSTNTTLAETVGVVRGALERLGDDQRGRHVCRATVDETGQYVLENPSNGDAWIKTQDIAEVRC